MKIVLALKLKLNSAILTLFGFPFLFSGLVFVDFFWFIENNSSRYLIKLEAKSNEYYQHVAGIGGKNFTNAG